MHKLRNGLMVAAITFSLGIAVTTAWYLKRSSADQEERVIIPRARWVPISFKNIDSVAKLSGQTDLRKTRLAERDVEMRMWWGFGLSPLEGISLRRVNGQWLAIHVKADNEYEPTTANRRELRPPKSGWEACWKRLVDAGILTLPDSSAVNCEEGGLDGISFVVETNTNGTYRTYQYENPTYAKCNEGKQMLRITELIEEEFTWKD